MNLVSIIIPVYNSEKYLKNCINSVLNQTIKNVEIIMINDNSTDGSIDIIKDYVNLHDNIKLIDKSINNGVSSARNDAIRIANGKYLLFIDSDDWLEKDMVENLYKKAIETDSDITICDAYIDFENNISKELNITIDNNECISSREAIKELLTQRNGLQGHPWNKLYKKNIIIENDIKYNENINIYEDFLFNLQMMMHSDKIVFVKKNLYHYIQRRNSLARTLKKDNILCTEYIIDSVKDSISKGLDYQSLETEFISFSFRTILNNILLILNSNEKYKDKIIILNQLITEDIKVYIQKGLDIDKIYTLKYHRIIAKILIGTKLNVKLFTWIWYIIFKPILSLKNKKNRLIK